MKVIVVTNPLDEAEVFASQFLPETPRIARSGDRIYRFYLCDLSQGFGFTDLSGQPLIDVHTFDTMQAAVSWVKEDARQRQALHSTSGRAQ